MKCIHEELLTIINDLNDKPVGLGKLNNYYAIQLRRMVARDHNSICAQGKYTLYAREKKYGNV